jgi:hypothetical protein
MLNKGELIGAILAEAAFSIGKLLPRLAGFNLEPSQSARSRGTESVGEQGK